MEITAYIPSAIGILILYINYVALLRKAREDSLGYWTSVKNISIRIFSFIVASSLILYGMALSCSNKTILSGMALSLVNLIFIYMDNNKEDSDENNINIAKKYLAIEKARNVRQILSARLVDTTRLDDALARITSADPSEDLSTIILYLEGLHVTTRDMLTLGQRELQNLCSTLTLDLNKILDYYSNVNNRSADLQQQETKYVSNP